MRGAAGARISSRSRRRRLWDVPLGHLRAKGRSEPRRARRSRRIPVDLASGVAGPQSCRVFSRWCVRAEPREIARPARLLTSVPPAPPQNYVTEVVSTMRLTTAACRAVSARAVPRPPPPGACPTSAAAVVRRRALPERRGVRPLGRTSRRSTRAARLARLSRLERARGAPRCRARLRQP